MVALNIAIGVLIALVCVAYMITSKKDLDITITALFTAIMVVVGALVYKSTITKSLIEDGYGQYNTTTGKKELTVEGITIYEYSTGIIWTGDTCTVR